MKQSVIHLKIWLKNAMGHIFFKLIFLDVLILFSSCRILAIRKTVIKNKKKFEYLRSRNDFEKNHVKTQN